ncbi:MAG: glycosyltransferase family 9 protein [Opitutales bacterium]
MAGPTRNLLIIRLSAIGDIVMATSILPGLRAKYPDARIHWLTQELGTELLAGHPALTEVWELPRSRWKRDWQAGRRLAVLRDILGFRRRLREARFDCVIDAQGLLKSGIWAWMTGAPRRVCLHGREWSGLFATEVVREPAGFGGPLCREYRHLAEHLELPMEVFGMQVVPTAEERARARTTLTRLPGSPVLCFPFTTRPQKHWFKERWSELADRLSGDGHAVWMLGGPNDLAAAEAIAAEAQAKVGIVAGPDSDLREKAALIAQAALCIGPDTGLTHLSLALGRPTVALFGSTCPYESTHPVPGTVLYDQLECAPCRRHPTCEGVFTCMRHHTVERVAEAARSLLLQSS